VLFVRNGDLNRMKIWLEARWVEQVGASGRSAIKKFSVNLDVGHEAITKYLNKHGSGWGLEDELARGVVKVARGKKGYSPFALLREHGGGKKWAGSLFVEYTEAFKGKSQLRYSRNLRKVLGLGEDLKDDEIMSLPEAESEYLSSVLDKDWALVERFRARGNLLEIASESGVNGVNSFLDVLRARAEDERGDVLASKGAPETGKNKPPVACLRCGGPVPAGERVHQVCRDARLERGGNKPPPVE